LSVSCRYDRTFASVDPKGAKVPFEVSVAASNSKPELGKLNFHDSLTFPSEVRIVIRSEGADGTTDNETELLLFPFEVTETLYDPDWIFCGRLKVNEEPALAMLLTMTDVVPVFEREIELSVLVKFDPDMVIDAPGIALVGEMDDIVGAGLGAGATNVIEFLVNIGLPPSDIS